MLSGRIKRRLALGIALIASMCVGGSALAQTSTTGAIQGTVRDQGSGDGIAGVTVVATSLTTGTAHSEITNDDGRYEITNLAPGQYDVVFYYADVTVKQNAVAISLGKVTPVHIKIDTNQAGGETIVIDEKAPTIDIGSTKQGVSIDQEYTRNIPVPGRTFASALGAAPGSQGDLYGVSFSGSSSLENSYIVDGINTTGLNFGDVGTALINEFIQETEIITGGYNAEFGRSTGGVVNVVTKSGTNEFHGSVFAYGTTEALTAAFDRPDVEGTSIDADVNLAYDTDFGFEVGGPIIKDKVWFYVGFAPRLVRTNVDRITRRRVDVDQNGAPDRDPDTDFLIYEELDSQRFNDETTSYQFVSKINFAVTPEHQGQVSITGTPASGTRIGIFGEEAATQRDFQQLTTDVSAKWTSKLNDNKTELEGVLGWHRSTIESNSIDDTVDDIPHQTIVFGDLGTLGLGGRESMATVRGCTDTGDPNIDDYPQIENCPDDGFGYGIGGIGTIFDDKEERLSAKLTGSQRVEAAGHHVFKVGLDTEINRSEVPRHLSGGVFYDVFLGNFIIAQRFVQLAENGMDSCGSPVDDLGNPVPGEEIRCNYAPDDRGLPVTGETQNWSAFAQDSWSILPNLTLNAGLRYEEQRLRYSKELQELGIDPVTGVEIGKNAMVMNNMWAPRVGLIYDWTKEGRSKVYGNWGRFYQSIPMRINERSFGGETFYQQVYNLNQCGDDIENIGGPSGENCPTDEPPGLGDTLFGSGVVIAPGVKPQFMDELLIGAEYEALEDLRLGIAYKNRSLGRVLEDVSVDNAETYIIANPGEFDEDEEDKLEAEVNSLPMDSPEREALQGQLDQFRAIRGFDKARRDYNAIEITANKRFSRSFFMQAAYTYSRTEGNFPGLFSPDTGQLDPNITSQFDLIELLSNRDGPLPQDRPHYIKFDGYYTWDFERAGMLTTGIRFRALSGTPIDTLGRHYLYGRRESYLLPRGNAGRTPFELGTDLRLIYGRQLAKGYELSVFLDLFSVFNTQGTALVDEEYTLDPANPIVGGRDEDLVYLKQVGNSSGNETDLPVTRKGNYLNASARYSPRSARFGLRLTF